jgi:signal transduction histidine kinase
VVEMPPKLNSAAAAAQPEPGGWFARLVQQQFLGTKHSLQRRVLLIVGTTLSIVLLVLYFPLELLLTQNTLALEAANITTDVERAADHLNTRIDDLALLVKSYATWDDTYSFVQNGDAAYLTNNHNTATMYGEQRDLFYILDTQGQVVVSQAINRITGAAITAPALPAPSPDRPNPLLRQNSIASVFNGLIMTEQGPLLISSAPIVQSNGSGPIVGTLIFGQFFTDDLTQQIASHTKLKLATFTFNDPRLPEHVLAIRQQLLQETRPVIRALDEYTINGYTLLNDAFEQPGLILVVSEERTLFQQSDYHAFYLALALLCTGLTSALVIHFSFQRLVLNRLATLSGETHVIGASGTPDARVSVAGNDELSRLALAINEMLAALQQAEHDRNKDAEERLKLQDEIIQTRRHLISRVSHELRTPLTPIKGFIDLLLLTGNTALTDEQKEILHIVRSNAERMNLLIDDLIDLGRAETGSFALHLAPVRIHGIVTDAIKLFQQEIERKQIQCILDIPDTFPAIEADSKRISQVLVNLISNAVKYTFDKGSITIRGRQLNAEHVEVQVIDTGIGLTSEQQQQIFTPFYRAESPLHTTTNGTGLGLLIARTLIEQHQGSLYVRSEAGKGSTFGFILPITQHA